MSRRNILGRIAVISFVIAMCTLLGCGETKYASPFRTIRRRYGGFFGARC